MPRKAKIVSVDAVPVEKDDSIVVSDPDHDLKVELGKGVQAQVMASPKYRTLPLQAMAMFMGLTNPQKPVIRPKNYYQKLRSRRDMQKLSRKRNRR